MGPASPRAIVVADTFGAHVARLLMTQGYAVEVQDPRSFRSLDDRAGEIALLVTDLHHPGANGGIELARRLRGRNPRLPVVLLADHLSSDDVRRLDQTLPGCPTVQSPPNGRGLAIAVAAARDPMPAEHHAPEPERRGPGLTRKRLERSPESHAPPPTF